MCTMPDIDYLCFKKIFHGGWGCPSVVQYMLSMCEDLGSILSLAKKKNLHVRLTSEFLQILEVSGCLPQQGASSDPEGICLGGKLHNSKWPFSAAPCVSRGSEQLEPGLAQHSDTQLQSTR